jgi:hypothetical protein
VRDTTGGGGGGQNLSSVLKVPRHCLECRLLGYKNPVRTSQETHYVSATESSQLMLCKIEVFTAVTMKNAIFWDVAPCVSCKNRRFGGATASIIRVIRIGELGTTLAVTVHILNR